MDERSFESEGPSGKRPAGRARPDLAAVRAAAVRIAPHVHRTPVFRSATLDRQLACEVYFKCENLQKVGAFKARGAVNTVLLLDDEEASRGVITHSSGNHAAALAYAARIRGISCAVVMPETAPPLKVRAVEGYGAEVVFCPPGQRETTCDRILRERGATFVHPFDDARVIAGQGTAALELLDEVPDLDGVVAPVGGGGLLAGTAVTVKTLRPRAWVWGAEPEAVDDAYRSMQTGIRQPAVENPRTFADGLLTGLGELNFEILRERGVRVVTVGEEAMLESALFLLQRLKLVVEPSAATPLAALRRCAPEVRGLRVGVILSGGNTDFAWLRALDGLCDTE